MYGIKDVAKLAGVSTGTVSRALNKSGYVSPKTRELVEKAIDKLNYAPNEMARSLSRNRTNIIGLIVPDISHPFFALLARYIETELYNAGYKTLICNTIQRSKRELEFLDMLKQHLVDGIIMAAHSLDTDCYQKFDAPIIAFDRNLGGKIPCISSDHKKGGRLAAEKLLANGCGNVLQLTSQHTLNSPAQDRHTVFAAVMEDAGAKCTSIELPWNDFDFFSYEQIAREILPDHKDIDGLFSSDMVVRACMSVLEKTGRRVPEDIRVIGYDGSLPADAAPQKLTTVVQPVPLLARTVVSVMSDMINMREVLLPIRPLDVYLREGDTTF